MPTEGFDPEHEDLREALCTLGNGYFATRGAAPESRADGIHYPGTYVAGCWNRLQDEVLGQAVANESMVNLPDRLPVTIAVDGGGWLDLSQVEVLTQRQELDLRPGLLTRWLRFRDRQGRLTSLTHWRFEVTEIQVCCAGDWLTLRPGETVEFELQPG